MTKISPINELDHNAAQVITHAGNTVTDLNPISWIIDRIKNLPVDGTKPIPVNIPTILDMAKKVIRVIALYHARILKKTAHWSEDVKEYSYSLTKKMLYPISFCKVGRALRESIADSLVGSVAKSVSFCVLQIIHIFPYMVVSWTIATVITLYHTSPVALITFLAGSILMIQVYLIFELVETLKVTNKTLKKPGHYINSLYEDPIGMLFQFAKNTLSSSINFGIRTAKWTWSWVPPYKRNPLN